MSIKSKFFSFIDASIPLLFFVPLAPYVGSLLFSTQFSESLFSINSFIGLSAVSVFFIAGLNSFNAIYDIKIDLINKMFRPVPSHQITKKEAIIFSISCFSIALVLSFFINLTFFALMVVNVLLAIFYSLPPIRLKEKYVISNIVIGLTFGFFPALLGWSVFGDISTVNWAFLISVLVLYTSISFLKDFEDAFGDNKYDVKTLPAVLGKKTARTWAIVSIVFSYFFILILTFANIFNQLTYIMVILLFWVWHINNILIKAEKGLANDIVLHATSLGSISVLSLALINTIF